MKFTLDTESNRTLPFLDILIHREDSQFKYSIYRKPINTLSYVHFYSNNCTTVKRSIFQSMYLRAYRIVSPEYIDSEVDNISNIGAKLCYPSFFMQQCHSKARKYIDRNMDLFTVVQLLE